MDTCGSSISYVADSNSGLAYVERQMMSEYIPQFFKNLSFSQLECLESNAISRHNNDMRFTLLRAAKGNEADQKKVMEAVRLDPTWIKPAA